FFPNGVTRSALLKAPAVAFDHLDDMHQAFLQQNFDLSPGSDSYLLLRGIRTLSPRIAAAQRNALAIVEYLKQQKLVKKLY
ncbi:PLP-dependent transferase, partial [Pantoea agglomerans]|uniref:PLP-dependent transferase n=1 Tax=Enterobacter agglomerans TaxID=549 RepID=UPI001A8CBFF4